MSHSSLPAAPPPTLDVIIVNFRACTLVGRALASLARHPPTGVRLGTVHVVDNSTAESDWAGLVPVELTVDILDPGGNLGFGAACNLAAARSTATWLLLLNPDAEVCAGTLDAALAALEAMPPPARGAVGVQLLDADGTVARSCSRFPTRVSLIGQALGLHRLGLRAADPFMSDWDHGQTREVDQAMGAFLLLRRDVFTGMGGFDRRFFLYFEDVDLCLRLRRAGRRVLYLATATARHAAGGSSGRAVDLRLHQLLRSRVLYAAKWFGPVTGIAVLAASALVEPWPRLVMAGLHRGGAMATVRGCARFWRDIPGLLRAVVQGRDEPSSTGSTRN